MNAALKYLEIAEQRFAALTKRERIIIALAAVIGTIALGDRFMLDPLRVKEKVLAKQIKLQKTELQKLDLQNYELELRIKDPDANEKRHLAEIRKSAEELEEKLNKIQSSLVQPEEMTRVLETLLGNSKTLHVINLRTIPAEAVVSGNAAKTAESSKKDAASPSATALAKTAKPKDDGTELYRHAIEVTVEGNYADLVDYLSRLEKAPKEMFWHKARLETVEYPKTRLTLTLYTLSLKKAWLVV